MFSRVTFGVFVLSPIQESGECVEMSSEPLWNDVQIHVSMAEYDDEKRKEIATTAAMSATAKANYEAKKQLVRKRASKIKVELIKKKRPNAGPEEIPDPIVDASGPDNDPDATVH